LALQPVTSGAKTAIQHSTAGASIDFFIGVSSKSTAAA
jgi:hypothetical protein